MISVKHRTLIVVALAALAVLAPIASTSAAAGETMSPIQPTSLSENPATASSYLTPSYYRLINRHTQMCLTERGRGNPVVQERCGYGRDDQLWLMPSSGMQADLESKNGVCVAYDPSNQSNTLFGVGCSGYRPWTIVPNGTYDAIGQVSIRLPHPHPTATPLGSAARGWYYQFQYEADCVDVDSWNHNEGGTIIHDRCRRCYDGFDNDNQLWTIVSAESEIALVPGPLFPSRSQGVPIFPEAPLPPSVGSVPTTQAPCNGICVLNLRTDPPDPRQRQPISFVATIGNSTGFDQKLHWFVFIYDYAQKTGPIGQTSSAKEYIIPPGVSDQLTDGGWKIGPGNPCYSYTAKVHLLLEDGSRPVVPSTNGQEFQLPFTVCP